MNSYLKIYLIFNHVHKKGTDWQLNQQRVTGNLCSYMVSDVNLKYNTECQKMYEMLGKKKLSTLQTVWSSCVWLNQYLIG